MHVQLRDALGDARIQPIPLENVNHRVGNTSVASLTAEQQGRVMNYLKRSYEVWLSKCGQYEPAATAWLVGNWASSRTLRERYSDSQIVNWFKRHGFG